MRARAPPPSPPRLHHQDPAGIDRLERLLSALIDGALRFSCQLWSRPNPLWLQAWKQLGRKSYRAANDDMVLCHAQQPAPPACSSLGTNLDVPQTDTMPRSTVHPCPVPSGGHRTAPEPVSQAHEGRPIIMVVQPAIEALRVRGADHQPPVRLLLSAPAPIAIHPARAMAPSTGGSQVDTPSDMTRDPVSPDTTHGGVATPVFQSGWGRAWGRRGSCMLEVVALGHDCGG